MHIEPSASSAYPNWLEIDLPAAYANTRTVLAQTGVALMAVVKANAYGMGAQEIGQTVLRAGASALAVARCGEALALRKAGITAPILVFGMAAPDEVDAAIAAHIRLTLHSSQAAGLYAARARALGQTARVHLKVDTGMGRMGVFAEEAPLLARQALELGGIEIEGVYTHFSSIDSIPDDPFARLQLERFQTALGGLREAGIQPAWVHTANSAAAFALPDSFFNMVRVGSALVGIRPFYHSPFPSELRRVLTWKTQLASVRCLPPGWGVGYGPAYRTSGQEWIAVLPAGYADGYRRCPANEVLIEGQRVPAVGRVCADMFMVRLPRPYPAGTEVVLLGSQGGQSIQIEDLSERWGISQADVTAGITARVPRVYLD